ncbi:DUF1836 domain-containing protein [Anaerorhabdus sp.]|jgi:hypothetical protein|uniref:DUF1836 domain-containing protein n=2 Tax=Anaerorhabdus sp. TaxID=1872524 RepID=UPI002FCAAECF
MYLNEKEISDLHLPRWNELPSLNLYMDQVVDYLQQILGVVMIAGQDSYITKTMINNYVNQGIIEAPQNKRYSNKHLAYLVVICIMKQVFSLQEISVLFKYQITHYPDEQAYNFFILEFESCFKGLCLRQAIKHTPSLDEGHEAVYIIRNLVMSVCTKLCVQNDLQNPELTQSNTFKSTN